jgi:hypothetical protein
MGGETKIILRLASYFCALHIKNYRDCGLVINFSKIPFVLQKFDFSEIFLPPL